MENLIWLTVVCQKWLVLYMRFVDLSKKLHPGREKRTMEIKRFTFPPGEHMHYMNLESHVGTHVEAPSHYIPARYGKQAKDVSQMPLEKFMGEAVFVDISSAKKQQKLKPQDIKLGIKEGDIVLFGNSPHKGADRPQLSPELIRWLIEKRIRMVGVDDSLRPGPRPPEGGSAKTLEDMVDHDLFLTNEIPIIEQLANLDKLTKKRFFFVGFPLNIEGLDSSPIRAVAIEEFALVRGEV
jgi:arylformamidase